MSMTISTEEKIKHYQRSIDRSIEDKNRLLHCIEVLSKLPVTVQHLQTTGIGRTVNALRKIEDGVGDAAKRLVTKWKIMVANTDTSEEEDEACVPDVPESYESPDCNSDTEDTLRKKIRNSDNVQPEALQRTATLSPPMELNIEDSPPNIPYIPNNDKEELVSDEEKLSYNTSESKKEHESRSSSHSSKHSSKSSSKDKNSSKDSRSKSSSHKDKHVSHKDKYESSKSSKHSKSSEDNEHKRKDKSKSKSDSSSSTSSSYKEEKKRKFESSSSEGESDKKKRKISSSDEGEEDEEDEENNFVINEMEPSEKSEEEEEEEKDYKESKTKEKESSRHDTSHSDKKKSKNKHHSSSSKTKSHESNSKSKKDKSSNSKSDERGKDEKRKDNDHHSKDSSKSKSSHSSSSSKDHSKDKDKNEHKDKDKHSKDKKKESNDKNHKDSKEKSNKDDKGKCKEIKEHKEHKDHKENKKHKEHKEKESKDSNVNKKSKKLSKDLGGGIDCNSGTSFADALGMCTMPPPSKKKKESNSVNLTKSSKLEQPSSSVSTPSSSKSPLAKTKVEPPDSPESLPLLSSNIKLEPLKIDEEVNLASTLPEPSPYYKPLPQLNPAQRRQNEDEMLSQVIYAKNQRTKVYSGNKSGWTNVPSLYEMCIRVLIENIDALEFTGGVPYYIIKPILERATPDQLFMLEHHNPYIIEDSDPLWQFHCNKDFRTKQREEMESWREMYMRCLDEREAKLKALTANIKQSIDKSQPVRSAKLAYVDNVVKPPRSVLRKQAKYGTANATSKASDTKKKILAAASGAGTSTDSSTEKISVPPPPAVRVRPPSTHAIKKTKAPLMAMALKAIKGRYKR